MQSYLEKIQKTLADKEDWCIHTSFLAPEYLSIYHEWVIFGSQNIISLQFDSAAYYFYFYFLF